MMTFILSVLGAFIVALVLERSAQISRWLISRSISFLPFEVRDDQENQWINDNNDVSGAAWKLMHALGCTWLCRAALASSIAQYLPRIYKREFHRIADNSQAHHSNMGFSNLIEQKFLNEARLPGGKPILILQLSSKYARMAELNTQEYRFYQAMNVNHTLKGAAQHCGIELDVALKLSDNILEKLGYTSFDCLYDAIKNQKVG